VDRTSKLVFARIYRKATKLAAAAFLKVLVKTVPYRIHAILTDNPVLSDCCRQAGEGGVQFTDRYQSDGTGWIAHIFGRVCNQNGIEHRLTKSYHP
jgi:transposase-like protein